MRREDFQRRVEKEWDLDSGFLGRLRSGQFDRNGFERFLATLNAIPTPRNSALLPRRFVSLLWYVPLFMEWQTQRVVKAGALRAGYRRAANAILEQVERILGAP